MGVYETTNDGDARTRDKNAKYNIFYKSVFMYVLCKDMIWRIANLTPDTSYLEMNFREAALYIVDYQEKNHVLLRADLVPEKGEL